VTVPDKQPITIKNGTYVANIHDLNRLLEWTLKNTCDLWKTMFGAADENAEAIRVIREWLPNAIKQTADDVIACLEALREERSKAEALRRNAAAFGSAVTKVQLSACKKALRRVKSADENVRVAAATQQKAKRLQEIFTEMAVKAEN